VIPKPLWAGILLVIAGCLALVGLNIDQIVDLAPGIIQERDLAEHAYEVIATANQIERALRLAESAERGYVITGQDSYLNAYGSGVRSAADLLTKFERVSAPNPAQQSRIPMIRAFVDRRVAELQETLDLRRREGFAAARHRIETDIGLNTMRDVTALIDAAIASEDAVLQNRLTELAQDQRQVRMVAETGVGLTLAEMAIGALLIWFAWRERERARKDLDETRSVLAQAQKMETLGQLAGGIAHDFNNMLAVVRGGAQLLRRRLASPEPQISHLLDGIDQGVDRAAGLTGRLLAFSRRRPLALQVTDANALVNGMTDVLRYALGRNVTVETALCPDLWPVLVDPNQLENAILNLAVNARDAMPEGGSICIKTANLSGDRHISGPHVMIAVQDTGKGMTPEVLRRAFEPFFTTKGEGQGTGLGLAQVHALARSSGGFVRIDSAPGKGSTVTLYFPPTTAST
jgi:signal transduction histidine kinase